MVILVWPKSGISRIEAGGKLPGGSVLNEANYTSCNLCESIVL